jgi:hypothetical protein
MRAKLTKNEICYRQKNRNENENENENEMLPHAKLESK